MTRHKQAERVTKPRAQTLAVYLDPEAKAAAMAERNAIREREKAEAKERGKLIRKARAEARKLKQAARVAANKEARAKAKAEKEAKALAALNPEAAGLFIQHTTPNTTATEHEKQIHETPSGNITDTIPTVDNDDDKTSDLPMPLALRLKGFIGPDATDRLSTVIRYLKEHGQTQLHYVKLLFNYSQSRHAGSSLYSALRCLLQVDHTGHITVLATMKVRNGLSFWLNHTETPVIREDIPIKHLKDTGYSFRLQSGESSNTDSIPNIQFGTPTNSDDWVYTANEAAAAHAHTMPSKIRDREVTSDTSASLLEAERNLSFTMGNTLQEYMDDITRQIPRNTVKDALFPIFHYLLQHNLSDLHFCQIMHAESDLVLSFLIQLNKQEGLKRFAVLKKRNDTHAWHWVNLHGNWAKPRQTIYTDILRPIWPEDKSGFLFQLYEDQMSMNTNALPAIYFGRPTDPPNCPVYEPAT